MKFSAQRFLICNLLSIGIIAASLAACGESQPPIRALSAMPQSRTVATHAERGGSWMLLEAKSEDLLYVADEGADGVFMYSHPAEQPVGTLSLDHPRGECVDEHPYNCAVDPNSGRIAVLFQVNGYYTSASRVRNAS